MCTGILSVGVAQEKPEKEKNEKDTTRNIIDAVKDTRLSKEIMKSVTRKPLQDDVDNIRSEEPFLPYEGKIIRRIRVNHIGFEKTITDTTRTIKNIAARAANALHNNSKEWLIRDHLFFYEDKPLNPYKLADNERFLRDQDFMLEARIQVIPVKGSQDSVDVLVVTRDVFSLGGSFSPRGTNKFRFRVYDVNVFGAGQRTQYDGLYDQSRDPRYASEFYYRKSSVGGTLVNATVAYTQLNDGSSYGNEEENAWYLRLDRPLVSPYSRLAGGLEFSKNWSQNFYNTVDTVFRHYRYNVSDVWLGYNIGTSHNMSDRSRRFVSARFFDQAFKLRPTQPIEETSPIYNSRRYFLGAFTFFRQDFYKTKYVYGFGRTEDVPYGHTMSILVGWESLLGLNRPYLGFDMDKSFVHKGGNFYTTSLRVGGFPYQGSLEDATILVSGQLFSKLKYHKKFMIRNEIDADFTYVFNQRTNILLDINGTYGIENFRADSLLGTKRLHARYQMVLYTPWKLLGFKFAPILFLDVAEIASKNRILFYDKPYLGIGTGVRTRNENLVFGTIELKFFYYPRTVQDMSSFNVSVSSNLRIKFSGSFVRAPSFISYN
ncbi:hypothetical protein JI741_19215 [Chryseolinea sp. Jin1]|uniref:POTRA domain-containing protein n=1 Tax=Chryseolinea lacunae TaxID=2801331 RepID=A0ABS1KV81_9BACT|nr:hypothetical protein [Chryseolinea lacunae]